MFTHTEVFASPDDESEASLNRVVIESLAAETRQPVDVVRKIYEREYAYLKVDARVSDFLAVCASRRARRALKEGGGVR